MKRIKNEKILPVLYLLSSTLLYYATSIFTPIEKGYKLILNNGKPGISNNLLAFFSFSLIFFALFVLHTKIGNSTSNKYTYIVLILIIILFFSSFPFFSGDIFLYSFKAKILLEKGISPYTHAPPDLSIYRYLSVWTNTSTAYGPLSFLLFKISYIRSFSPFMNMFVLKFIFFIFFLLTLLFLKSKDRKSLILFAFSPLILIETLLSPHFEIIPLFFFILSLFFLKEEKENYASLLLAISSSFKINYIIFLIPFIIKIIKEKKLQNIFSPLLFFSFGFFPPLISINWNKYFSAIKFEASKLGIFPLFFLKGYDFLIYFVLSTAFLFFSYLYIKDRLNLSQFIIVFFLVYLLSDKNFQPWHIFPIYGIYATYKWPKFDLLGFSSLFGVYSVYFLFYSWNPTQNLIASFIILFIISVEIFTHLKEAFNLSQSPQETL